ncbi:DUF2793 domain-containing protein [Erythrobacter litoralis]|uniref:DUF2793 domain-containing protein n=1 Tax=Erythrobacter litoralis (strain HTCC2594) TaxID=314225 RepID=Q2N608_ERYLH|nr:DUF2793 domain-containing protein [Erythrobacter litoralis]ABC64883.1 hypothetical protein ELI_13955 [Erythrobacter litoralis HTCC2594]
MTTPIAFQSVSARHALPFLFAAQAQKEIIVNEAISRIDALLHPVVSGTRSDVPPSAIEGECWIVGADPVDDWSGSENAIACFTGGDWTFVEPVDGMACWDLSASARRIFVGSWQTPVAPELPSGGATVDAESRQAIADLVNALTDVGILRA